MMALKVGALVCRDAVVDVGEEVLELKPIPIDIIAIHVMVVAQLLVCYWRPLWMMEYHAFSREVFGPWT